MNTGNRISISLCSIFTGYDMDELRYLLGLRNCPHYAQTHGTEQQLNALLLVKMNYERH